MMENLIATLVIQVASASFFLWRGYVLGKRAARREQEAGA
jgi:hypothetical protein